MQIDIQHCCTLLGTSDDILILCHRAPDGDTVGAAFGLFHALSSIGKRAAVKCSDNLPEKFGYIFEGVQMPEFEPRFIVSVDVADKGLLGPNLAQYADRVDLCIDHHISNTFYAGSTMLNANAAAACEVMYSIINSMGVPVTQEMATALYTGLATDTGCFRYANTTAATLRTAANLIEAGANNGAINAELFEKKSRMRIELERRAMDTLSFEFDGRCAVIEISQSNMQELGATIEDVDGISAIPRQIEGVQAAVTLRENRDGSYKVSLRSTAEVDSSAVCGALGGGGHRAAAGCVVPGPLENARRLVLTELGKAMGG